MAGERLNKEEILKRLRAEYERLWTTLTHLTPEQITQPQTLGDWSVKDAVAHLIFWNYYAASELQSALIGKKLEFDHAADHNADTIERYRERSWIDVVVSFAASYQDMVMAVEALPAAAFEPGSAVEQALGDTVSQALNNNTYDHYALHEAQIRAWMQQAGIVDV